jgi:hypothetical protein
MNIFALHPNPRKCARWHVDKHVVKMLLETCQLLYTAHWVLFYPELTSARSPIQLSRLQKTKSVPEYMLSAPSTRSGEVGYRPCHVHHPCAVWTRQTAGNYQWLFTLGLELAREYRHRFHKTHSCEAHIRWLAEHRPPTIKPYPKRPFVMAMADEYKVSTNPIISYRNYYRTSKKERGLICYTGRHVPHWLSNPYHTT